MTDITTAKMMGIMGSLLVFIGILINFFLRFDDTNTFSFIIMIIFFITGILIVLISMKFISDETKNDTIFTSYFLYSILWIVALCMPFIIHVSITENTSVTETISFIVVLIVGIVSRIIYILASCFLTRSFRHLAKYEKNTMFNTIGPLYIAGTSLILPLFIVAEFLTVETLPVIGGIFLLIAAVIQIVAFSIMPEKLKKPIA